MASLARVDRACINLSPDSESCPYLEAHLSDGISMNALGSLRITRCSPLVSKTEEREESGKMNAFFDGILSLVESRNF